jgi:hypothetical protein
MIGAAVRRGLLTNFPLGAPLAIVAPDGAFDDVVAARNDPATTLHVIGPEREMVTGVPVTSPNVIVEGLDAVADPIALLTALRAAAPAARLFALVSNAAHLPALAAYFAGAAIAAAHPLVRADVERMLAAAAWNVIAVEPVAGEAPFAPEIPGKVQLGALTFALDDAATIERVRPAAFLAIADPA